MLEVKAVIKTFDSTRAVDGITFTAKPGEIFGLIGPWQKPASWASPTVSAASSRDGRGCMAGGWL